MDLQGFAHDFSSDQTNRSLQSQLRLFSRCRWGKGMCGLLRLHGAVEAILLPDTLGSQNLKAPGAVVLLGDEQDMM